MDKDTFVIELNKLGVEINKKQMEQLDQYYRLLVEWNEKINLTRIIEEKEVYLKHFYDSITLCKVINLDDKLTLLDIGTGAGFPGIVLKIVFPNLSVTLVDALLKRVNFLNKVIETLELKNIRAVHFRAEDYAKLHKDEFDIVTCRAVANLSKLLGYAMPLVNETGYFIPMKANCDEEINDAQVAINRLHSKIILKEEFELPNYAGHRTLLKISKNNKKLKINAKKNSKEKE